MPLDDRYEAVRLRTDRGDVECRYYARPGTAAAAVWVGGAGGGWDTPARRLYPRLCMDLLEHGIDSLRVRFRHPAHLSESVFDVLAGLSFLADQGVRSAAVTGHSFGGAVVIAAGVRSREVRTVVTLATQGYGAHEAGALSPRSILLVHGTEDEILPARSSQHVHDLAREPKRLVLYPGARHGLDEVADEVRELVRGWIISELHGRGEPA
ncbi:MAG: dienelactone hydrolase family protein [Actinomycetota bacterium]|nr:dienelactone hydrolase family protein [Actinomycetota bacterium]